MLTHGHIFLNTSLTEAYCMAIVEAASCGLQVVSTSVGGIPEVLPSELITLTEPNVESIMSGVLKAIERVNASRRTTSEEAASTSNSCLPADSRSRRSAKKARISASEGPMCPFECNDTVSRLYNWNNVTLRTETVYQRVLMEPDPPFGDKLNAYYRACVPFLLVVSFSYLLLKLLDWFQPRQFIDVARDLSSAHRRKEPKAL